MSIFILVLGLALSAAGSIALGASLNLVPDELGLLYAACGTIGLTGGFVVIAIAALIRRVDGISSALIMSASMDRSPTMGSPPAFGIDPEPEPGSATEPLPVSAAVVGESEIAGPTSEVLREPALLPDATEIAAESEFAPATKVSRENVGFTLEETPANANRSGHFPSLEAIERALAPEAEPEIVGKYSAGGAHYKIYSDGSIEAETESGRFKFASMTDFKTYLAGDRTPAPAE